MIYRVKKEARFTVIDNQLATDSRLSFGARGLLVYLLSKPDNWEVRLEDLVKASPAGRTAVSRMIHELEEAGYMRRVQERREGGTFAHVRTEVYESPQSGFPQTDKPQAENQPLINTEEEISTELTKNLIPPNPQKGEAVEGVSDWIRFLEEWSKKFPNKPKPRMGNRKLRDKLRARMSDPDFKLYWVDALARAAHGEMCPSSSWFDAGFFLRNDDNWEKCLHGKYDKAFGSANGKQPSPPVEQYIPDADGRF